MFPYMKHEHIIVIKKKQTNWHIAKIITHVNKKNSNFIILNKKKSRSLHIRIILRTGQSSDFLRNFDKFQF